MQTKRAKSQDQGRHFRGWSLRGQAGEVPRVMSVHLARTHPSPPFYLKPKLISALESILPCSRLTLGCGGISLQLDSDDLLDAPVEAQSAFYEGPGVSGWWSPSCWSRRELQKLRMPWLCMLGGRGCTGTKLSHHPGHREGQRPALVLLVDTI